jgi:hypothetical protein
MATVINNPTPSEPTVVQTDSSGWVVAVVILLLAIVAGVIWYFHHRGVAHQTQPGPTVNVTLPAPQGNSTGSY